MKDVLILSFVIIACFALVGWLSILFQRRFNLQRNYLYPRATKKTQATAIITALVSGLVYFIEIQILEQSHGIFLLIAIIALVYSFRKPQDSDRKP